MSNYGQNYGGYGGYPNDGYGYQQQGQFNPMADGYGDQYGQGQNLGRAVSQAFGNAASLSSQNAQASYYPEAMVQQAALALQGEQLKQQGMNQRLGAITPLFAALFGLGGSSGGMSGKGAGFTSNFGQSVH